MTDGYDMEATIRRLKAALGEKYREGYDNALAEQPFDRAAIIEECARVADGYQGPGWKATPGEIARAIRALKDRPHGN